MYKIDEDTHIFGKQDPGCVSQPGSSLKVEYDVNVGCAGYLNLKALKKKKAVVYICVVKYGCSFENQFGKQGFLGEYWFSYPPGNLHNRVWLGIMEYYYVIRGKILLCFLLCSTVDKKTPHWHNRLHNGMAGNYDSLENNGYNF